MLVFVVVVVVVVICLWQILNIERFIMCESANNQISAENMLLNRMQQEGNNKNSLNSAY